MTEYLDLKFELVCIIAKETLRQTNGWDNNYFDNCVDFSNIESEISKELDELLTKVKGTYNVNS